MTAQEPVSGAEPAPPTAAVTSNVIRGTLWGLTGSLLPQAYLLVSSIVTARLLGVDEMGQLTFITFAASTLGTLLTLGFPDAVTRFTAEAIGSGRPNDVAGLYRWMLRFGAVVGMAASVIIWIVALAGGQPRAAWFLAGISSASLVLHQAPSVLLIGTRRWRDSVIVGTSTGLVALGVRIAVLLGGGGIVGVIAVEAAFGIVNVVLTSRLARRAVDEVAPAPHYDHALIMRMVRFAFVASIGVVITWIVFRRSEVFFLQYFSTPDQVAIYSIPFTLVATMLFLPQAVTYALRPTFATLYGAGHDSRVRAGFGRSVRMVTTFAIVATAYALLVGPAVVTLLYGSDFAASGVVLRILLLSFPIVPMMTLSTAVLAGLGRQWFATGVLAVAAVVNLTLDFFLIRAFDATGAAIGNSSAQIVASLPLVFYAGRVVGGLDLGGLVLIRTSIVSTAALLLGLAALHVLPVVIGLLASTIVFAVVFLILARPLPVLIPSDAEILAERAGARGRGVPRALLRGISGNRYLARAEG
jgi:O-antigen/teichoic acid export membrane protein